MELRRGFIVDVVLLVAALLSPYSWGNQFWVSVTISEEGRLHPLIAYENGGNTHYFVAAYNPDMTVDKSFGENGFVQIDPNLFPSAQYSDIQVARDGSIKLVGYSAISPSIDIAHESLRSRWIGDPEQYHVQKKDRPVPEDWRGSNFHVVASISEDGNTQQGRGYTLSESRYDGPRTLEVQSDGRILVASTDVPSTKEAEFTVTAIKPDLSGVDTEFGSKGRVEVPLTKLVENPGLTLNPRMSLGIEGEVFVAGSMVPAKNAEGGTIYALKINKNGAQKQGSAFVNLADQRTTFEFPYAETQSEKSLAVAVLPPGLSIGLTFPTNEGNTSGLLNYSLALERTPWTETINNRSMQGDYQNGYDDSALKSLRDASLIHWGTSSLDPDYVSVRRTYPDTSEDHRFVQRTLPPCDGVFSRLDPM